MQWLNVVGKKTFFRTFFSNVQSFQPPLCSRGGGVGVEVNYIKNNLRTLFYVIKLR